MCKYQSINQNISLQICANFKSEGQNSKISDEKIFGLVRSSLRLCTIVVRPQSVLDCGRVCCLMFMVNFIYLSEWSAVVCQDGLEWGPTLSACFIRQSCKLVTSG